jgi:nicotinate dehydrogenase subunit B
MNIQISRREALLGSGALVVSFSLTGALEQAVAQNGAKPLALTEVDSFLAIDQSGKVIVYSGKVELGTGVYTALQQIGADEIDVPMSRIEMIQGDTLLTPNQGPTWGSVTIQVGGMQLRQAAAAARQALMAEAAK